MTRARATYQRSLATLDVTQALPSGPRGSSRVIARWGHSTGACPGPHCGRTVTAAYTGTVPGGLHCPYAEERCCLYDRVDSLEGRRRRQSGEVFAGVFGIVSCYLFAQSYIEQQVD